MHHTLFRFIACCLLAALAPASLAASLYQVSLPVADQAPATFRQAAREGLAQVLVRLSGQTDLAAYPALEPALGRADALLEQFSYAAVAVSPERPETPPWRLSLQFSQAGVERLMRQADLPVWPVSRPAVLLWPVIDDGEGRRFPTRDRDPAWFAGLADSAARRGLPLQWPLLDIEDRLQVDVEAIWRLDETVIRRASARYGSAWIAAGRFVRTSEGRWLGQWVLWGDGLPQWLDIEADTPELAATLLVTLAADSLAARYAIVAAELPQGSVELVIEGIGSFADYMASRALLASLVSVHTALPVRVEDDRVHYRVALASDRASLDSELRLRQEVVVLPATTDAVGDLHLRWRE